MEKLRFTLAIIVFFLFTLLYHPIKTEEKCGVVLGTVMPATGRIVGGVDVGYFKYPWYVALMKDGEIYCGGTLVHKKYIVSAAHCYEDFFAQADAGKIKLENVLEPVFGVYNICDSHEQTQKHKKIAKVFIHEKYNKNANYYDISVLKLKKNVNNFEPCCLPTRPYLSDQRPKEGLLTGLGDQKYEDKDITCTAKEGRVLIYSDDVCKKMLDDSGEKGSELKGAFCAGYLAGGVDACQGDSGGPLMVLGPNSSFFLLGVVSFGDQCALPNRLGVYTDVSQYLDWMYNKMKIKPKPPTDTTSTDTTTLTTSPTKTTSTDTPTLTTPPQGSTSKTTTSGYLPSTNPPYTLTTTTGRPHHHHPPQIIIIINRKKGKIGANKMRTTHTAQK